jgi:cytochrome oxidase Cu insertion factor (SCO1/SenC/PrrC family)
MEGVSRMIKKSLLAFLFVTMLAVTVSAQVAAPSPPPGAPKPPPPAPKTHLKVGQPAPDFNLPATDGKTYKLSDFKNKKNVVLAIYVLAFTGG